MRAHTRTHAQARASGTAAHAAAHAPGGTTSAALALLGRPLPPPHSQLPYDRDGRRLHPPYAALLPLLPLLLLPHLRTGGAGRHMLSACHVPGTLFREQGCPPAAAPGGTCPRLGPTSHTRSMAA